MNRSDEKPEILAVIPARGGSKGIPRKNIKELCGKPLIAYSIQAALKTKLINRVIVSTEDEEIAEISKSFGAEVPFLRPAELARDRSSIGDAIQFTLTRLQSDGYCPDIFLTLYPTHPFRTITLMDFLAQKLTSGHIYVHTAKKIDHSATSLLYPEKNNRILPLLDLQSQKQNYRTQSFFRFYGLLAGKNYGGFAAPFIYVIKNPVYQIDIDTLSDFHLAEEVIKQSLYHSDAALDEMPFP
jgi:N-acylneuraminate cytidylyltransferase